MLAPELNRNALRLRPTSAPLVYIALSVRITQAGLYTNSRSSVSAEFEVPVQALQFFSSFRKEKKPNPP